MTIRPDGRARLGRGDKWIVCGNVAIWQNPNDRPLFARQILCALPVAALAEADIKAAVLRLDQTGAEMLPAARAFGCFKNNRQVIERFVVFAQARAGHGCAGTTTLGLGEGEIDCAAVGKIAGGAHIQKAPLPHVVDLGRA